MIYLNDFRITKKGDSSLKTICKLLDNRPIIVKTNPKFGCKENLCHWNVNKYVNDYGGKKITGYYLITNIKDDNLLIAIKHSIWENKGKLIDITPFSDNRKYNVFIESKNINFKSIELYKSHVQSLEFNI